VGGKGKRKEVFLPASDTAVGTEKPELKSEEERMAGA